MTDYAQDLTIERRLKAKDKLIAELLDALKEIEEGRGRFSCDPLTHAGNCIEDMKQIATEAIRRAKEG